ncbi:RHS repeat-associated core domain-containing protein [Undibacterium sp. Ji42W]|uniref:RHS repeat-associated core domain-containing protein n=1 Tax=Undibacterium sp. Ji42W TaxID=3413039 RepID=UPI003BF2D791
MSTKTTGGQVAVYGWNADNRLVEVKQGSNQATAIAVARYSYDSNGNRVQKSEPGQNTSPDKVTNYLVDETFEYAQTVQETTSQAGATESTSYVWGNGLIQQSRVGQLSYYHADALGSTKALTNSNGSVTDAYQYDAFGAVLNNTGITANNYRYTGEYFDDIIELQYNRARWYSADSGRFVSVDSFIGTFERPLTLNKYLYASANPLNILDPSGLENLPGLMTGVEGSGTGNSIATPQVGRMAFKKTGCALMQFAADETINYGIYILTDGLGNFYVGQSNDITRRYFEHLQGIRKKFRAMVAVYPVERLLGQAGKDLLQKAEQYVMDALKDAGHNISNSRNAISKSRGRLRNDFLNFCK